MSLSVSRLPPPIAEPTGSREDARASSTARGPAGTGTPLAARHDPVDGVGDQALGEPGGERPDQQLEPVEARGRAGVPDEFREGQVAPLAASPAPAVTISGNVLPLSRPAPKIR